jgi:hypothetical protein
VFFLGFLICSCGVTEKDISGVYVNQYNEVLELNIDNHYVFKGNQKGKWSYINSINSISFTDCQNKKSELCNKMVTCNQDRIYLNLDVERDIFKKKEK